VRPEQGLLQLRKALGLFANLRPVVPHPRLSDVSPIKSHLLRGVDMLVVRELTGGIYFGAKTRSATEAVDECRYSLAEIERVVRLAATLARSRRRKLTSVDKANVLETSRLWRATVDLLLPSEFPDVAYEHVLVDSAAMYLLQRPRDFDVIVTENMFGDILTDEASMLAGSMGLLPSASLGAEARGGLFEPIHGSAPDIAGRGIANPYAAILSAAMLLRHALRLESEAEALERAVYGAIESGALPADLIPRGMATPAAATPAAATPAAATRGVATPGSATPEARSPGPAATTRAAADAVLAAL
jgi:3-isopropylmalate dehydrogenase